MLIALPPLHQIPFHYSAEEGSITFIYHSGKVKFKTKSADHLLNSDNLSFTYDRCLPRSQANLLDSVSLFWEITLGPHLSSKSTVWC